MERRKRKKKPYKVNRVISISRKVEFRFLIFFLFSWIMFLFHISIRYHSVIAGYWRGNGRSFNTGTTQFSTNRPGCKRKSTVFRFYGPKLSGMDLVPVLFLLLTFSVFLMHKWKTFFYMKYQKFEFEFLQKLKTEKIFENHCFLLFLLSHKTE